MLTMAARVHLGRAVPWSTLLPRSRQSRPTYFDPFSSLANDNLHHFEFCSAQGQSLPRQSGLCPRASVGAQRRVRRGPSLGELAPAGVNNSRGTLHALPSERPTMTAFSSKGWNNTPALASLTPSESNVSYSRSTARTKTERYCDFQ